MPYPALHIERLTRRGKLDPKYFDRVRGRFPYHLADLEYR